MKPAALGVTAALWLLMGCGSLRAPELAEPVALSPDDALTLGLLDQLQSSEADRNALRASAQLMLEGAQGRSRLNQLVVLDRPARLRLEIQGFLATAAVLVSDGKRYDYFQASNRYREQGLVRPTLLWEIANVALTLEQAVHLLLGFPPPVAGLEVVGASRLGDGSVHVDLAHPRMRLARRLEFDALGRLRRVEEHNAGSVRWEVVYDRYRDVGSQAFAHSVSFDFPPVQTRAQVSFGRVELNPEVNDEMFRLQLTEEAQ